MKVLITSANATSKVADRIGRYLPGILVIGISLAVTLWFAMSRGQDFNWDQQNYHIGVPFLLQHRTFWNSIAPAGAQSFYNPYVVEIEYFGLRHLPPIAFTTLVALGQSVVMAVAGLMCLGIAKSFTTASNPNEAAGLGLLGFALCLMAPVVLSEAGTTFIDFLMAAPVVTAFALLLFRDRFVSAPMAVALSGGLIGAATALKLTNAVFALGALGFAFSGREAIRRRLQGLALYAFAAVIAFLAIGGRWHLALWERFRNPVFPYFNNVFRSADFDDVALRAERYLPHSVLDIWHYPLYWMLGGSPNPIVPSPSAEVPFADARWALLTFASVPFLGALAIYPAWRRDRLADPSTGLFFAVTLSYLIWLDEFAVQRYLAPVDVLCGAALLFLVMQIRWRSARLAALVGATAMSWVVLAVPDWTHLPWSDRWQGVETATIASDGPALVFLTAKPSLYIAASLPADWRYVGAYGDIDLHSTAKTIFARQLRQTLSESPETSLKEVDRGVVPSTAAAILAGYGLSATGNCRPLTMPDMTLRLCDVVRAP